VKEGKEKTFGRKTDSSRDFPESMLREGSGTERRRCRGRWAGWNSEEKNPQKGGAACGLREGRIEIRLTGALKEEVLDRRGCIGGENSARKRDKERKATAPMEQRLFRKGK